MSASRTCHMKIIFNSSLPRSGSTLLQNILQQNPSIYCSPTSGLIDLLYAARASFTTQETFKLQPAAVMRPAWLQFCRGALEGFYRGLTDRPIACEKSRGWVAYYDWLQDFYPSPKVICCVRDLRSIISSMEKLSRKNSSLHDPAENQAEMKMVSIESRVSQWMNNPPVGLALTRLRDCLMKGHGDKIFFLIYEEFVQDPSTHLKKLYEYIEEPAYSHDLDTIPQTVLENDAVHGVYGDHTIRNKFGAYQPDYQEILGDPISNGLISNNKWFYRKFYPQKV